MTTLGYESTSSVSIAKAARAEARVLFGGEPIDTTSSCYLLWHAPRRNPGQERAVGSEAWRTRGRIVTRVLLKSVLDWGQIRCQSASLFWQEEYRSQARPGMSFHSGRGDFKHRQLYCIASHGSSGARTQTDMLPVIESSIARRWQPCWNAC